MQIDFHKYHGAGNDFIIIDNREYIFDIENRELTQFLCHRRFGVGADGILLLESHPLHDFEMVYLNSDGSRGSMCGNGGRCIVKYAEMLGLIANKKNITFIAIDGQHDATISENTVSLRMQDMKAGERKDSLDFIYCGTTPHHIQYVSHIDSFPVVEEARKVRETSKQNGGVNVNYVEQKDDIFYVRTYERGVEDETLACGTGACSVVIVSAEKGYLDIQGICKIRMTGGDLSVQYTKENDTYTDIWLSGEALFVFEGKILV